ncbi:MAG: hypothetical protein JWO12_3080 [Frankiales bacterium]|jgi:hypothetical protein|nr:hypothetical protein [Frankiales bacterium]
METQREPTPRNDEGERDTALSFLRFARHCLLKKTEGLDEEQLRRVLVPSGTSLLGLVQHCTHGEQYWFHHHVGGGPDLEWDFSMQVPADTPAEEVVGAFEAAVARSDEILAATEFGALTVVPVDGRLKTVRWVVAHKTSELARHAGHADILREQLDGTTGR